MFTSRRTRKQIRSPAHERIYALSPYADTSTAIAALEAAAPPTITLGGRVLVRSGVEVDPVDGRKLWMGRADYSLPELEQNRPFPEVGDREISVRIVGESQTLRHSYFQRRWNIAENDFTDFSEGGPINDAGDGPEGCEVLRPSCGFTERWILAEETVDADWVRAMSRIVGRTNDATFRGFEAGELLLLGIEARSRPGGDYEAHYSWAVKPNIEELPIAGITITDVEGWTYVWVKTEKSVIADKVRHKATDVVIEQVYLKANYGELGIPDPDSTTTTTGA